MADNTPPVTTMKITDIVVGEGDAKDHVTIAVLASRAGRTYTLPYQIQRGSLQQVDIEFLKAKVLQDVDAREATALAETSKIKALKSLVGKSFNLD